MNSYFRFFKSDTPELLNEIYRLRFKVYCEELNFLNPANYPDGLEIDEYDPYSIHFAAIDHEDEVIGTIRLIKGADIPFPIEVHCRLNVKINGNGLHRKNLVEISRLAVSKKYRKRVDDGRTGMESYPIAKASEEERRELEMKEFRRKRPEIVLGLYRMMYYESKLNNITHWFAAMEKKLWEVLSRYGILFTQIGEEVDYYGPVIPYLGQISDLERFIYQRNPELYKSVFLAGLDPRYWPEFIKT